jgi:hypothetical protein
MLDEAALEALRIKFKKIARVAWEGHEVVFRRPTRDEWHSYLRAKGSPMEAHTAQEHHSQITIVAYDGDTAMPGCRIAYTNGLLEECPGFANAPELGAALSVLAGTAQEEEIKHLGEVVRVLSARHPSTRTDSPNGSATAPTVGTSSATTDVPLRS